MKKILLLFIMAVTVLSCAPNFNFQNTFDPSPRVSYERKLKREFPESVGWLTAHQNALATPRAIKLPHGGNGRFAPDGFTVYCYRFDLQVGEILDAKVLTDSTNVFIDLYALNDTKEPIESNERNTSTLETAVKESGTYILTVQAEAGTESHCVVLLNKRPLYSFPVAGKGNSAIQSFWEAPRDGGARRHEGIDIFAKKGTPVVAVTNGMIADTGDRGLGGKQVWQREGIFGKSIYYAHLDEIAVTAGTAVKVGDTLGYVGNTGNAKGGPPHLHFGIYDGYEGAINPLPFVYRHDQLTPQQFLSKSKNDKFPGKRIVKG